MVKFMLDPGHDLNTLGKGVAGMKEFEFNRAVVEKMIILLNQYEGTEVFISHDMYDGIDQSLSQRVNLANSLNVNCFCSVHANAASSPAASGIETFADPQAPADTVNLGAVVHGELIRATGMNNRGLKRADFYVLDKTNMNAFLVECGFMTNPGDLAKLKDDGYRQTCAQAIVNGLVQHYGLKKKQIQKKVEVMTKFTKKVVIPNTAFWQTKNLIDSYMDRGYKCYGEPQSGYEASYPKETDPWPFIIETTPGYANQLINEFKKLGYDLVCIQEM